MAPDALHLAKKVGGVLDDLKFIRDEQVGLQFLQAAVRDPKELTVFGSVVPPVAFSDIRWDRDRR